MKELKEERVKKQELKAQLKELGKPKRPVSAFIQFYIEEATKGKVNVKVVKAKYDTLTESQKNAYKEKANAGLEEYR